MTQTKKLLQIAQTLAQVLPACGSVVVFGHHLVRPGDVLYELVEAEATDEALRIHLHLTLTGKDEWIEVIGPSHVQLSSSALRVREATTVRAFGTDWTRPPGETEAALVLGD